MSMHTELKDLDATIFGEQREQLQALLGEESWALYEKLREDWDDEDEFKLGLVQFSVSLDDPEAFKALLTDDQRVALEAVESTLKEELGL